MTRMKSIWRDTGVGLFVIVISALLCADHAQAEVFPEQAVAPSSSRPKLQNAPVASSPVDQAYELPNGSPPYAGVVVHKAEINSIAPAKLLPGSRLMVTLDVLIESPIDRGMLVESLVVLVDTVAAEQDYERGSRQTGADLTRQMSTDIDSITLFALAPREIYTGPDVQLSVYSTFDHRVVASAILPVGSFASQLNAIFPWFLWAMSFGVVFSGVYSAYWILLRKRRRAAEERIRSLESSVQVERRRVNELGRSDVAEDSAASSTVPSTPPVLPDEVMTALDQGDLVLVIGAGVSSLSGLPTGISLWLNVLDRNVDKIPEAQLERLRSFVTTDITGAAVELIVELIGRVTFLHTLRDELLSDRVEPSRFHELLASLPVPAIIDMTWDDLMPRALAAKSPKHFGPTRQDGIAEAMRSGEFVLLKPVGDLRDPDGVTLTPHEYRRTLAKAPELGRSIAALFSSRTLLFFGFSVSDLGQFLSSLPPEFESSGREHFAVVQIGSGVDLWQAGVGKRYGVNLIEFQPSADFHELDVAAEALAARASRKTSRTHRNDLPMSLSTSRLTYLELRSIGFFRTLRVDFAPGWTLLLGDNGGGKSTILRSAALALAGNDARTAAAGNRLLRTGDSGGKVELGIGKNRVVTSLVRDGPKVLVKSPQTTARQAGQILVLAFPALRGVTATRVLGPTVMASMDPSVDDIAPLLEGVVDNRLDDLQQWVVNTSLRAESDPSGREARMFDIFRSLIADMVPGGGLEFSRVDRHTWDIVVRTNHGEMRFDSVSQGMSAILNWVGVLLHRLYDVYPRSKAPHLEPAIVLIDEIDAHLHPNWQRRLVALTREHFPNVQIIASSHSPLLAGAVERSELRIVAPDEETGEIQAKMPREDISGQKAEDILVSSLFSLETTRSLEAEETIRRYFALFEKDLLSPDEQSEFATLSERLQALNYGPTLQERELMEQSHSQLDDVLSNVSPEAVRALNEPLRGGEISDQGADPSVKRTDK